MIKSKAELLVQLADVPVDVEDPDEGVLFDIGD